MHAHSAPANGNFLRETALLAGISEKDWSHNGLRAGCQFSPPLDVSRNNNYPPAIPEDLQMRL